MSLYDWFFPEQAQAAHLRRIAEQNQRERMSRRRRTFDIGQRVSQLERDTGFLCLVLGALLQNLKSKGTVTVEDLNSAMSQLDGLDGVTDGEIEISILKDRHLQNDVLQIMDSDPATNARQPVDYSGVESPIPTGELMPDGESNESVNSDGEGSEVSSGDSLGLTEIDAAIARLQAEISNLKALRENMEE